MRSHADYVPLHLHTEYSLLDGAIRIDELVKVASSYNLPAIAITDHGNIFGAIEFYEKVTRAGMKPIIGSEVYVAPGSRFDKRKADNEEGAYHLILLARNMDGYRNLTNLLSRAYTEGFYYKPRIDKDLLEQYSGGLIALTSCMKGEIPSLLLKNDIDGARKKALYYKNLFGPENFYIELQANGIPEQMELNKRLYELAKEIHVPVVATNDCHYLRKEDARAHEILLCIQTNKTINDSDRMRFATDEFYFKSPDEMRKEFSDLTEAIRNSVIIAERCNLVFDTGKILLPDFRLDNISPQDYLERVALDGLSKRFNGDIPPQYMDRFREEIRMINKMGYASYFLIVWDFIRYARENNIPVGPGRGSVAGSLIAYSLGITEIDPIKYNLLFERFLNPERISMPDIDVDFCRDRRQEVLRYVTEKYGAEQVAQIITFGTMAARAVVRDVGRTLGMPYSEVDRIAKLIPQSAAKDFSLRVAIEMEPRLKEAYENNDSVRELIDIAMRLEGLVRHASVHAAGVVISPEPLTNFTALYMNPKGDNTVTTHFDYTSLEKIGLIKFDFLGLDTLTTIDKTLKYIKRLRGIDLDINSIPLDDRETYRLLSSGKTVGIFQLESPGMRELIMKLSPDRFEDLIALVALYRPGPLGSGMIDDFIKRKKGEVPVEYIVPELKEILDETYGVILYQEQVMRISNRIAGFTLGQADILRRAISKKDPELMERLKTEFIDGAVKNNFSKEIAEKLFDLIEYFGNYGFNKSHSAAYAFIAYQTAYLKTHFPCEFMAASLSTEMDKTDKIIKLINELRDMSIELLPPDINKSEREFTIDGNSIRFGLEAVKGVGSAAIDAILEEREKRPFDSFDDFLKRVDQRRVNKKVIEGLIKAGAFTSLGITRREAMLRLNGPRESKSRSQINLFDQDIISFEDGSAYHMDQRGGIGEEWDEVTLLAYEKEALGFYITGHPLMSLRPFLKTVGITSICDITEDFEGRVVTIAGLVTDVKRLKTRGRNELMAFVNMEDESASTEVIVFPELYRKSSQFIEKGLIVVVTGTVDVTDKGLKLLSEDLSDLDSYLNRDVFKKVELYIDRSDLESEKLDILKRLFIEYSGRIPLYIRLNLDNATPDTEMIVTIQSGYSISPDINLIKKIQNILGYDKVEVLR